MATRPPMLLPTSVARSTASSSSVANTVRANQAES